MPVVRVPRPSEPRSEPSLAELEALAERTAAHLHGASGYEWVGAGRMQLHSKISSVWNGGRFGRNLLFGARLQRTRGPFAETATNLTDPDVEIAFTSEGEHFVVEATGRHVLDTYRFLQRFARDAEGAGWLIESAKIIEDLDQQRRRQIGQRSN